MTQAAAADLPRVRLHIGEKALDSGSGGVFEHRNPATGQVQARIPLAGPSEIDAAATAADEAFMLWRKTPPSRRRDMLLRLAALVESNQAELTRIAALENGAPVRTGAGRAGIAREWLRYYASWADKLDGTVNGSFMQGQDFTYSKPEPYGVIGVIVTWNVPLISLCMKVAPALAAGNTVVIKPSELTPFTAEIFTQLARQAGIPAGVVNTLPGTAEAGNALVVHPRVKKITFTGGGATARKIMAACADHLKPSVMELGGKSANIIFGDANLDTAAHEATLVGLGAMAGQACVLGSRILVQDSVYDAFLEKLVAATRALPFGDPSDPQTIFGPVINEAARERILSVIAQARQSDAGRLVTGGNRISGLPAALAQGYFVEPTIFADVAADSDLAQQEVFGPVVSVIRFSTEEEAIALANGTRFGLAAYIHSSDISTVHRVADQLDAGSVYVNGAWPVPAQSPFGGNRESGFGREGGKAGIEEFLRPKTVAIARQH